jgi:hypothetical protein
MSDVRLQLNDYSKKLDALQKQCAEAEKDAIIAETNYKSLIKQKEQLVDELEAFAGTSFDQVPELLKKEQDTLQGIMDRLSVVNVNGPVTPEVIKELESIMTDFGIPME